MQDFASSLFREALRRCESEPIEFIGAIQSHGVLVAVDAALRVCAVSANFGEVLHIQPEQALGRQVGKVLGEDAWRAILTLGAVPAQNPPAPVLLPFPDGTARGVPLRQAFVHRIGSVRVIEIEAEVIDLSAAQTERDAAARVLNALLAEMGDMELFAGELACQIRTLTGFDRVMVYRFDHQWNGQVIAQSRDESVESFLGHHFPASDIPEPARRLYAKNLVRMLPDRDAPMAALLGGMPGGAGIDLSFSVLRGMSSVHRTYLKNLGVAASLSISLLQHGKLWGLVVCHHRVPKVVPLRMRDNLELIARTAAMRLSAIAFDDSLRFQVELRSVTRDLLAWTQHTADLPDLPTGLLHRMFAAVGAQGLALVTDRETLSFGEAPARPMLGCLRTRLLAQWSGQTPFVTHALAAQHPDLAVYCDSAAGLLAISLDDAGAQLALWFRSEEVRSIEWAGDEQKALVDDEDGPRLEPRSSFARWVQTRRGESDPWDTLQLDAAHTLSMTLGWILARARLRQSERRYRSLIDWSPDALIVHREGRIVYLNPAAVQLFAARSEAELLGSELIEHIHSDHRDATMELLSHMQRDEEAAPLLEGKFLKIDGTVMDVELKGLSITYDGAPAHQMAMRDVTERRIIEDQLRISAHALKSISQGVLIGSVDGKIVSVNDAFARITGYGRNEVVGQDVHLLIGPLTDPNVVTEMDRALAQGGMFHAEMLNHCKDGRPFWNESTMSPVRNAAGTLTHFVGIVRDVTLRKVSEQKIKLAASVFTHAREGIFIAEPDGTIIDINETFTSITGYERDDILGKKPNVLKSGRHESAFYAQMWNELLACGHWQGEIWNKKKNGVIYPEILSISAVAGVDGSLQHYVGLFTDISLIKSHESQLEKLAHFDSLTGLPNRVLLSDRLREAMNRAQRSSTGLAVVNVDLDGFKAINDRYGHEVGDQLLVVVADRIARILREGDTLARFGGDEFVAVFDDVPGVAECVPLLDSLLDAASAPIDVAGYRLQVTASLGVSLFPQSQVVDADMLVRQADQALYKAKQAGKNLYHIFDADQDRSVRDHHECVNRLVYALRNGEFVLYYQPKVNMRTGQVLGVEALIRWQHPHRGLLAPGLFLPEIENHPLAVQLGEWVIDTALAQAQEWLKSGLDLHVSVNVGAIQLQQVGFVDRLRELLAAHPEVGPHHLEIEVLETSALEDTRVVTQVIEQCHQLGVRFALDDFGTGYSSLTYLKRLPVSVLKIDQSFVRGMLDDSDDLSILDGVLGLALAFRRAVIAEGVETVAHGAMLLQLGCDMGQGYGIARPMPAAAVPDWVQTWRMDPSWMHLHVLDRRDLPLLYAAADHRAWVIRLEKYVQDTSGDPPLLNPFECRFGRWLSGEGRYQHAHKACFDRIVHLHRKVHTLGAAICFHHDKGSNAEAQELLPELYGLRDALLDELSRLVRHS
ncbi:EAL domain-containing protein [Candidatus Symbiobacter mobilis]|uniref:Bacteriophytochrome n=1 Tax=Candidatus Symbiobacter mobilis CR TaxID=946483 RepID=U5N7F9_9BURK|nr:EAL domain-containing protein [Candidatus Symbiobacter mobilis]AGX87245.1 bacteriophytochrome [Candidatus Symbiobacter mobilis CR]